MSLVPGTRLGPYEVLAPLGEGGMGEVYRARDTRLDRTVAIKVLSPAFADDPALRQRLQTEARAISQLSHPHICTLHDIGEQDGNAFLVMELIDGETLADRLKRQAGRALPIEEALRLGVQIADALAAAHRRGIVHRDLKPGNVMLTRAGSTGSGSRDAKLLDFGLAKVLQPAAAPRGATTLPTTPPLAATVEGTLLGTFQYMSPEQVEGAEADARSDVFALGCVLYEMFTGHRAFDGRSPAGIMAAILEREPVPVSTLQPAIPALIAGIVEKCLAKNPDDRWQNAADLSSALRLASAGAGTRGTLSDGTAPHSRPWWPRTAVGTALVALAALLGGAALAWRYAASSVAPPAESRFEVAPPPGTTWSPSPVASTVQLALSPDGRRLAFVAGPRGSAPQIWIRPLDSLQAQPLAGTDDATFPFWSPDGRFIGFFAGGQLKKVDVTGGTPQVLAEVAPLGRGGAWNAEDIILFTPAPNRGIWSVPAAGGSPTPVTSLPAAERATNHVWPQFLTDGRRFIYYQRSNDAERQGVYVSALGSEESLQVLRNDGMGVLAPGHLLVVRDGTLFAQAIDDEMRPRGTLFRVADGVGYTLGTIGYSPVSAAGTTIAYGPSVRLTTALQWRDRTGSPLGPVIARGVYRSPRLSMDDQNVVLSLVEEQATSPDIWILDLGPRGTSTRVTNHPSTDWFPVWAARGDRVFFGSARTRATTVFQKDLAGAGREEPVIEIDVARYPLDTTANGWVVFQTGSNDGYDLGYVDPSRNRTPVELLATPSNEVQARIAPNTRWMAYASDESGRFEVYVRGFPTADRRWTISASGGMQPEWRRDGRELFFISSDRKLMAVPVTTEGDAFSAGVPRALFEIDVPQPTAPFPGDYAVSADGQRFLVSTLVDEPLRPSLTVVLNWAGPRAP
jgi:serine/threonine protein kinase